MEIITISKEELFSGIQNLLSEALAELRKVEKQDQQLLSKKDLSRYYDVHRSTIDRWVVNGKLTPYYQGGRVYFKRSDLPLK